MKRYLFPVVILVLCAVLSQCKKTEVTFTPDYFNTSWDNFRKVYIQPHGSVIDPSQDGITTSEGQSYALLRSAWMDDRETFDTVYTWTRINLMTEDHLFAWKWGQTDDNKWEVLDHNTASDADQDIALALILASRKWNAGDYLRDAKKILKGIWEKEVFHAGGNAFISAGNWATEQGIVNLSYFSPYAYEVFKEISPEYNWDSIISGTYDKLFELIRTYKIKLIPDFCKIDVRSGKISLFEKDATTLSTDFSFDAVRLYWRVTADYLWYNRDEALRFLKSQTYPVKLWKKHKVIYSAYTLGGDAISEAESFSFYGSILPYFSIVDPDSAIEVAHRMNNIDYRKFYADNKRYYDQNWLWFGTALYAGKIVKY